MSKTKDISIKIGTPLLSTLLIIFVIAKILGLLDWSWWWVFSPIWLPILLIIAIVFIIFVVGLIVALFNR